MKIKVKVKFKKMVACTLVLVCAHPALIRTPQPSFLPLYVHPTTLAADGAAVASPAAAVAASRTHAT